MTPDWQIQRERVNQNLQMFRKLQNIMHSVEQRAPPIENVPFSMLIEAISENNVIKARHWQRRLK